MHDGSFSSSSKRKKHYDLAGLNQYNTVKTPKKPVLTSIKPDTILTIRGTQQPFKKSRLTKTDKSSRTNQRFFSRHKKLLLTMAFMIGAIILTIASVTVWPKTFNHSRNTRHATDQSSTSGQGALAVAAPVDSAKVKTQLLAYQKQLGFPLFMPARLPQGYTIVPNSFKIQDNLLTFYIKSKDGVTIAVSEQKKTANFTTPKNSGIKKPGQLEPHSFDTPLGKGTLFQSGTNSIALLEADATLILCNVNTVRSTEAEALLRGFDKL